MLKKIYYNHFGIDKCKEQIFVRLFWFGMSKQITDTIQNCETCLHYQRTYSKEMFVVRDSARSVTNHRRRSISMLAVNTYWL